MSIRLCVKRQVQRVFQIGYFRKIEEDKAKDADGRRRKIPGDQLLKHFNKHLKVSSGEEINSSFMSASLSIWQKLLVSPRLKDRGWKYSSFKSSDLGLDKELLLLSEEVFGKKSPFADSLYKIRDLMSISSNHALTMEWVMTFLFDNVVNFTDTVANLSHVALTGGKNSNKQGPEA